MLRTTLLLVALLGLAGIAYSGLSSSVQLSGDRAVVQCACPCGAHCVCGAACQCAGCTCCKK